MIFCILKGNSDFLIDLFYPVRSSHPQVLANPDTFTHPSQTSVPAPGRSWAPSAGEDCPGQMGASGLGFWVRWAQRFFWGLEDPWSGGGRLHLGVQAEWRTGLTSPGCWGGERHVEVTQNEATTSEPLHMLDHPILWDSAALAGWHFWGCSSITHTFSL